MVDNDDLREMMDDSSSLPTIAVQMDDNEVDGKGTPWVQETRWMNMVNPLSSWTPLDDRSQIGAAGPKRVMSTTIADDAMTPQGAVSRTTSGQGSVRIHSVEAQPSPSIMECTVGV